MNVFYDMATFAWSIRRFVANEDCPSTLVWNQAVPKFRLHRLSRKINWSIWTTGARQFIPKRFCRVLVNARLINLRLYASRSTTCTLGASWPRARLSKANAYYYLHFWDVLLQTRVFPRRREHLNSRERKATGSSKRHNATCHATPTLSKQISARKSLCLRPRGLYRILRFGALRRKINKLISAHGTLNPVRRNPNLTEILSERRKVTRTNRCYSC